MSLLLIEGFEQYQINVSGQMARGGWAGSASAISSSLFNLQAGRHAGGTCVNCTFNTGNMFHSIPATTDFTLGLAFRFKDGGPNGSEIFTVRSGSTDQLYVTADNTGEIRLYRGDATLLDTSVGANILENTWYYIELQAKIDNSVGTYEVRLDGATLFSDTGVDTQNAATADITNLELWGHTALDPQYDDIYILDDSGLDNIDFLGDCRVETVFPDADGNENDFTPLSGLTNYEMVDDGLSPDDDTSYNHSVTATDRDLYGFAALAGDVGAVFGVAAHMLVRKEEAGFREVRVIARSNVTEVESGDLTLGIDYVYRSLLLDTDPDGGGSWDEAAVNAAQFGIDLQT